MRFEDLVYPRCGVPLAEGYEGRFESVFIVLHPFIRVPEALSWKMRREYPEDKQLAAEGEKCCWSEVGAAIGLNSCARMNHALLTSIGAISGELADSAGRDALQHFLETQPVWMPTEGRFEPILQADFLRIFDECGAEELIFVPEFPDSQPVVRLSIDGLNAGTIPFPACGTLAAPDASFLLTVDWDSFFTLFYGPRTFISSAARRWRLEGFFATANTEHTWWNYSMGCATVTVSPEDWQTTIATDRLSGS